MYGIEQYIVLQDVENYNVKIQNNKIYRVEGETVFEVDETILSEEIILNEIIKIKGEYPKDGYVEIGENKITSAELVFNNYVVVCTSSTDCTITGKYSGNIVAVTNIEINEVESTELKINETLKLSVTIMPEEATNKRVTWTSDDENVAKVSSSGVVTGISEGTATITVKSKSDNTIIDTIVLNIKTNDLVIDLQNYQFTGATSSISNNTENTGIIIDAGSGWNVKRIYMEDINFSNYTKFEITYSFKAGWNFGFEGFLDDGTTYVFYQSESKKSFSTTTTQYDLPPNLKKIGLYSSSQNSLLYIYNIKFIGE